MQATLPFHFSLQNFLNLNVLYSKKVSSDAQHSYLKCCSMCIISCEYFLSSGIGNILGFFTSLISFETILTSYFVYACNWSNIKIELYDFVCLTCRKEKCVRYFDIVFRLFSFYITVKEGCMCDFVYSMRIT